MARARIHCFIAGRVQGVSYRAYTQREATQLGLGGWVRNCADGRVELVAEGEQDKLQATHLMVPSRAARRTRHRCRN